MSPDAHFLLTWPLFVLALVAVMGAVAAVVHAARRAARSRASLAKVEAELARVEAQLRDHMRQLARMRGEQTALTHLFRLLPNVARDFNRSDLRIRDIPELVGRLAEAVFEPEQVLLFFVRSPGGGSGPGQDLALAFQKGVSDPNLSRMRVKVGQGKIGWVAEHKLDMLAEDWLNLTRTEGRSIPDNHPALRLDLIGPLVHHHHEEGERLLGVLSIGGPRLKLSDERLMLQMITNLGSIAFTNVVNVNSLKTQADHDGMTGLLNKRSFMKKLGDLILEAERAAQPLGLFIFDIDHFKHYNDSHGHLAGDEVLRGVARVLKEQLRPEDVAGRYGGEEFVVVMPQTDENAAMQVAERIREAIASTPFARAESQPLGALTISGGVAVFPVDANAGTELLQVSDQGLYQAKGSGRNRVVRSCGVRMGDPGRTADEELAWLPDGTGIEER